MQEIKRTAKGGDRAECGLGLLELEPECLPTHQHVAAGRRLKLRRLTARPCREAAQCQHANLFSHVQRSRHH